MKKLIILIFFAMLFSCTNESVEMQNLKGLYREEKIKNFILEIQNDSLNKANADLREMFSAVNDSLYNRRYEDKK